MNTVILSTDEQYFLEQSDIGKDIWILKTPRNDDIAIEMRKNGKFSSVTVYFDKGSPSENVREMFYTILEHHPTVTKIIARGSKDNNGFDAITDQFEKWKGENFGSQIIFERHP